MRTDDRRRAVARCAEVAGWGSQDIPSGSYPGTPRSPVRHPEIDGSKGPGAKPRTRKVHPPLSSSDVGGGLPVWATASISRVRESQPCLRLTSALSCDLSYGLILTTELLCIMGRVVRRSAGFQWIASRRAS